jgi:diguanylate cyclase (GGDEF)-like protein
MNAREANAARARPDRVEVLHETQRTRVTRLWSAGHTVIRKELLGPDRFDRLRHELGILERLRGVAGVAQVSDEPQIPGSILLDDIGGEPLSATPMPMGQDEMVRVALRLARAVAEMHDRGVMHRDIGPANILLSRPGGAVCLVDFALATSFAEIRPTFTHHNKIVGTLPYLAPEQTGRTGRPVDQRADLYALGATLYEVATGNPPFGRSDALALSHDVLARVPVAPAAVNPAVPADLSDIVMHLVEKEPDNRYQTAAGLVHDLERLIEPGEERTKVPLVVGERDFPMRLLPPSRLCGREPEIARLTTALSAATAGKCRGIMVRGSPGIGKTALIDELRAIVTTANGWLISGKFDQYHHDEGSGLYQAFRALAQLLLAEPEDKLAEARDRFLALLGSNAGLLSAMNPAFGTLLNVAPEIGDPLTAATRSQQAGLAILRAAASPTRPLVLVVDDLQWASPRSLGFFDVIFADARLDGLLVVGAYRDDVVDGTHPLRKSLERWQQRGAMEELRLGPLGDTDQAHLVADMLHVDSDAVSDLVQALTPHAKGNPNDTIESVNALRRTGILVQRAGRWWWDPAAVRDYLATADVGGMLAMRLAAMPSATQAILWTLACLGGRVELRQLQVATGDSAATVERELAPALDDGLLVMESGTMSTVRLQHDRIQETILGRLDPATRDRLQLSMARRLAAEPDLAGLAAQQYLPVLDDVSDGAERQRVADLLRRAADQAKLLTNYPAVDRFLDAATRLTHPGQQDTLIGMYTARHAALFNLGRLGEADGLYATIVDLSTPLERVNATLVQISSLISRGRDRAAIKLGGDVLGQLGLHVPPRARIHTEIDIGFAVLHRWLDESDEADDLRRPEITDSVILSRAAVINRMIPATYRGDQILMTWLTLQALQILVEHGPGPAIIGPAGFTALATTVMHEDYRTGYRAIRRMLALSEARGYADDAAHARFILSQISHWFRPLEDAVLANQQAREGIIRSGDPAYGSLTDEVRVPELLDCTPSLDMYREAIDAGLLFARSTGNEHTHEVMESYRRLVDKLRSGAGPLAADGARLWEGYADNLHAKVHAHICQAIAAAIFGDQEQLATNTAVAMPMLATIAGNYSTAVARVLRVLALAGQVAGSPPDERGMLLAELDDCIDWLAAREEDAPTNLLHLLLFAQAERARSVGDFRAAMHAFDAAQREAATRRRPWHRGLILERSAQLYLADGMQHTGYALLADAREEYRAWGASAKLDQLDLAYPGLLSPPEDTGNAQLDDLGFTGAPEGDSDLGTPVPGASGASTRGRDGSAGRSGERRSTITSGAINLLGVLSASQALSSETSVDGLRARVADVLGAMTGATGVTLLLRGESPSEWFLSTADSADGVMPVEQAARQRLIPMPVVRYAQRLREPLVVTDAVRDERFARDPYFSDVDACSLLAVPVLNRGELTALLLLENRLMRAAFAAERLGGVKLIAGQLAVSLENAMVHESLERKVAQSTRELEDANRRLQMLSITDSLTGLANRRHFEEVLDAEWQGARPSADLVALAMIDIDHFKFYNDRYGHRAGDRRLQRVAATLQQNIRGNDLLARYGGEEFAVIMPATDIAGAREAAERLRVAVLELAKGRDAEADIITVSIGIAAAVPAPDGSVEQLIEMADAELYRAKRGGRNRVCVATGQ